MDDCLMRKFTWKGQLKKGISSDDKEKEGLCHDVTNLLHIRSPTWTR